MSAYNVDEEIGFICNVCTGILHWYIHWYFAKCALKANLQVDL